MNLQTRSEASLKSYIQGFDFCRRAATAEREPEILRNGLKLSKTVQIIISQRLRLREIDALSEGTEGSVEKVGTS